VPPGQHRRLSGPLKIRVNVARPHAREDTLRKPVPFPRFSLQSTGFLLDPDGRVVVSVYSSEAIGRLLPEDVKGMIRYLKQHASA